MRCSPPPSPLPLLSPLLLCASMITRNYLLNRSDEKGSSFYGRSQFSLNFLKLQIIEGGEGHCVDPVNVLKLVCVFRRRRVVLKRRNFHQTFSRRVYSSSCRRKMLLTYEMSNSLRLKQKSQWMSIKKSRLFNQAKLFKISIICLHRKNYLFYK